MKHTQGTLFTGYVTIVVVGKNPELFFQACINNDILVWNIKKTSDTTCQGNIKLNDVKLIKKIRRQRKYKIKFIDKKGYPFLLKRLTKRKEIVTAFLVSMLFIIVLSNIVWDVKITGVSKEVEAKVNDELKELHIYPGRWLFLIDDPSIIQQKLLNDIPELLWVGVHKKGTTLNFEGVEKTIVNKQENNQPRHLIASANGVITSMYVPKGLPKVKVNDYVKQGDLLVSGIVDVSEEDENDDTEKDANKKLETVISEGEIRANTWYNIAVTIPLKSNHEVITGNKEQRYAIQIGDFRVPIWGFGQLGFKDIHTDETEHSIYLFKWELPLKVIKTIFSEKVYNERERTKKDAINLGVMQAKKELQLQLGPDIKILSEKILHETIENGKVSLNLYFTVDQNIVKFKPITQGD